MMPQTTMFASMEEMLANSFKDYHVRGFDYICLRRDPEGETSKLYFFDGDVSKLPEVVTPHDHRYHFDTTCLSGRLRNTKFVEIRTDSDMSRLINSEIMEPFNRFRYSTPLNGGDGFTWAEEVYLADTESTSYQRGQTYHHRAEEIHTIRIEEPGTILMLSQHPDVVQTNVPTSAYFRDAAAPSLDGLYSRFNADGILKRLEQLHRATGVKVEVTE
jgi:hypothetical protein